MFAPIPLTNVKQILSEPIHPHLKLHGVDSGVRDRQTSVGNVFIADACGKGATVIVEELKTQRSVRKEVNVGRIQRHGVVAEEHSAAEFEIWHGTGRAGKVPL